MSKLPSNYFILCDSTSKLEEISNISKKFNAQIITFGALITGAPNAKMYTDIWLSNDFQKERSGKKVDKINLLDE